MNNIVNYSNFSLMVLGGGYALSKATGLVIWIINQGTQKAFNKDAVTNKQASILKKIGHVFGLAIGMYLGLKAHDKENTLKYILMNADFKIVELEDKINAAQKAVIV